MILITHKLFQSNAFAIFGCFIVGIFARCIAVPLSTEVICKITFHILLTTFCFTYCFEIAQQSTSVKEDEMNKPNRPIPSGILSLQSAYRRWTASWLAFPSLLHFLYGRQPVTYLIIWNAWVFYNYVWPKPTDWFFRNAFSAIGLFLIYRLENAVICQAIPQWSVSIWPDVALSVYAMLTIHLQEFHDVKGDRIAGRRTLPIILGPVGQLRLRYGTGILVGTCGIIAVGQSANHCKEVILVAGFFFLVAWTVTLRTMCWNSEKDDEITYRSYHHYAFFSLVIYVTQLELVT